MKSVVKFVVRVIIIVLLLPILLCLAIVHLFGVLCDLLSKAAQYLEELLGKLIDSYCKYWGGILKGRK